MPVRILIPQIQIFIFTALKHLPNVTYFYFEQTKIVALFFFPLVTKLWFQYGTKTKLKFQDKVNGLIFVSTVESIYVANDN